MATQCTRCEGTGFLNLQQVDEDTGTEFDNSGDVEIILNWIKRHPEPHDVQVCDCFGDGDTWYGVPGEHYNTDDPIGSSGPYASNGGLCKCH
jgi:hypothetical protein